jgi:hypothetical protein
VVVSTPVYDAQPHTCFVDVGHDTANVVSPAILARQKIPWCDVEPVSADSI